MGTVLHGGEHAGFGRNRRITRYEARFQLVEIMTRLKGIAQNQAGSLPDQLDAEGRIVQGNPAGVAVWAGARYVGPQNFGEYKGWWVSTGEPIAPEEWAAARAIRSGETSIDEEIKIECFDGAHKVILNSAVPLFGSDGRITGAIIVNQDITARKHAETERSASVVTGVIRSRSVFGAGEFGSGIPGLRPPPAPPRRSALPGIRSVARAVDEGFGPLRRGTLERACRPILGSLVESRVSSR